MYKMDTHRRKWRRAFAGRQLPGVGALVDMLGLALLVGILVVPLIEATSRAVTQMELEDSARMAAVTAAASIDNLPLTASTAQQAYNVAAGVLGEAGASIDIPSFRVLADGSVRFTAHQDAPSVVLGRLGVPRKLMLTSSTVSSASTQPEQAAYGRRLAAA